jgi:hypothetical protein
MRAGLYVSQDGAGEVNGGQLRDLRSSQNVILGPNRQVSDGQKIKHAWEKLETNRNFGRMYKGLFHSSSQPTYRTSTTRKPYFPLKNTDYSLTQTKIPVFYLTKLVFVTQQCLRVNRV